MVAKPRAIGAGGRGAAAPPAHLGLKVGAIWVQKWSKMKMCKTDPGPFGVLKNMFLARLGPVSARFEARARAKAMSERGVDKRIK